jgi:hypothetical protein
MPESEDEVRGLPVLGRELEPRRPVLGRELDPTKRRVLEVWLISRSLGLDEYRGVP